LCAHQLNQVVRGDQYIRKIVRVRTVSVLTLPLEEDSGLDKSDCWTARFRPARQIQASAPAPRSRSTIFQKENPGPEAISGPGFRQRGFKRQAYCRRLRLRSHAADPWAIQACRHRGASRRGGSHRPEPPEAGETDTDAELPASLKAKREVPSTAPYERVRSNSIAAGLIQRNRPQTDSPRI
jgi:hypothetical protein